MQVGRIFPNYNRKIYCVYSANTGQFKFRTNAGHTKPLIPHIYTKQLHNQEHVLSIV